MRQAGELAVTEDMSIDQINSLHPQAPRVLAGYHIGGCASCAVDGYTTLGEAMAGKGKELKSALAALNALVAEGDRLVPEEQLQVSNIQLVN
jgi:hypothetical protein